MTLCRQLRLANQPKQHFRQMPPIYPQLVRRRHQGFHGLLQYAEMSWTLEPELASTEDIKCFWENVSPIWEVRRGHGPPCPHQTSNRFADTPLALGRTRDVHAQEPTSATAITALPQKKTIWEWLPTCLRVVHPNPRPFLPRRNDRAQFLPPHHQLSDSVVEQDICGLVLSTCVRMKQHFVDATGVNRVIFAEEPQPPRPSAVIEKVELQDAELTDRESSDSSSSEVEIVEEVDRTNAGNAAASAEIPKTVLPEMLRVQEYFER